MTTSPSSPRSADAGRGAGPDRTVGRRAAEWAFPVAAAVVGVGAPLLVLGRLPSRVAAHWSGTGAPDGSLPLALDVALLGVVVAAIALGPLFAARGRVPRDVARLLVGLAGAGGVAMAGLRVASVQANLDVATWREASALPGATLLATAVLAVVAGAIGAWAAGDRPDLRPDRVATADVEVQPGEAVVWSGAATSRLGIRFVVGALVLLAVATVLVPVEVRLPLLGTLLLLALLAATLGQVRVTIGPAGLTARLGALGWPRVHVPIEDITDVRAEEVVPSHYGGWGYRFVPGVHAIVVRQGPGLRLERRTGRALVVTVDGAGAAAGVLLAHGAGSGAASGTARPDPT